MAHLNDSAGSATATDLAAAGPLASSPYQDSTTTIGNMIEKEAPKPAAGPPPPPNGGTRAWLQVLGAWFLNFNTWGMINTFGTFQSEYARGYLSTSSASAISWIGSLQAFLMLVVGVLCGRALDAGYFYTEITIGVFLEVFGMMSKCADRSCLFGVDSD